MNTELTEEASIQLVVGLGNPGRRYASTRHNIGFMVLDALSERHKATVWREERQAATANALIGQRPALLLKPMTFMNRSGHAVRTAAARLNIGPAAILVVSDDLDLPFGRLRLRPDGSTGGHNGLRSIEAELGTQSFPRLRIGIGRPLEGDPIDWVLSPFSTDERADLRAIVDAAVEIAGVSLEAGVRVAMNQFNGRGDVREPLPAAKPAPRAPRVTSKDFSEVERG